MGADQASDDAESKRAWTVNVSPTLPDSEERVLDDVLAVFRRDPLPENMREQRGVFELHEALVCGSLRGSEIRRVCVLCCVTAERQIPVLVGR